MDPPTSRLPLRGASSRARRDIPLVRAAVAKRHAERAFEDYVREMSRRWKIPPDHDGSGADGGPLPRT